MIYSQILFGTGDGSRSMMLNGFPPTGSVNVMNIGLLRNFKKIAESLSPQNDDGINCILLHGFLNALMNPN